MRKPSLSKWILGELSVIPTYFAGVNDVLTNLGKGEKSWLQTIRTHFIIFDYD